MPPGTSAPGSSDEGRLRLGPREREEARWLIRRALEEDHTREDLTTGALFGRGKPGGPAALLEAAYVPREGGVICGLPVVRDLFRTGAPRVEVEELEQDGRRLEKGRAFLMVRGPAHAILRLERISLNFLQRLSGIASHTRRWVDALSGTSTKLLDTRKTTPGWRFLEKYAVRAGGGENHRADLAEAVLLKDNHWGVLRTLGRGEIPDWVRVLRKAAPGKFLQVEVANREELLLALDAGVDSVLLDNFSIPDLRWAVEVRSRRGPGGPLLEASGGIRLEKVREVAATGVERISVGALTHSSVAVDIGLDLVRVYERTP